MNIVFLDLEFSRRKKNSKKYPFEIIEVGYVVTDMIGNIKEEYSQFIRVEDVKRLDERVLNLTDVKRYDFLYQGVYFNNFSSKLKNVVNKGCYFITWGNLDKKVLFDNFKMRNIEFDKLFASLFFDAQKAYMSINNLNSQPSLKSACKNTSLDSLKSHKAIYDCYKTLEICKNLGIHNVLSNDFKL